MVLFQRNTVFGNIVAQVTIALVGLLNIRKGAMRDRFVNPKSADKIFKTVMTILWEKLTTYAHGVDEII